MCLISHRPTGRGDARAVLSVQGRRYGVRFTDFRGGRHLVTIRELEGRRRWAFSYGAGGGASRGGTLAQGGRTYRISASGRSLQTDLPGVSLGSMEGEAPQTQFLRGILVGIAVVIAAIRGDKVEIENANGSKVTIGGDGSSGYRAEPGLEEDPGVWY
ncbi:MAG: hypothetical protein RLN75_09485 [Longimicrobiales bacterium]